MQLIINLFSAFSPNSRNLKNILGPEILGTGKFSEGMVVSAEKFGGKGLYGKFPPTTSTTTTSEEDNLFVRLSKALLK